MKLKLLCNVGADAGWRRTGVLTFDMGTPESSVKPRMNVLGNI